jgi:hypothetical protein
MSKSTQTARHPGRPHPSSWFIFKPATDDLDEVGWLAAIVF